MLLALIVAPADVVVARGSLPNAGPKTQQGWDSGAAGDKVTQLHTEGGRIVAQVVVAMDVCIP